jgi:acetyl esterase/lipase
MPRSFLFTGLAAVLTLAPHPSFAQLSPAAEWAAHAANQYQVAANVTYLTANNYESKLDVYSRRGATTPQPTVVYFHGGFWAAGSKEGSLMSLIPWMEMGWNVVNVEYRLARIAPAPAAVEDCLCALRYLAAQAKTYNIDLARLVVTGESAGGHLTLTSAMIPESAGLDRQCAGNTPVPKVAAAVNWFGITDVADVIDGPNKANLAVTWLGSLPNKDEIAKRVSPLTYVRPGLPPILTIHGDKDQLVPYSHATRLHEALTKAGVPNQLLTIPNGRHGNFTPEERTKIFATIREFLKKYGLGDNP